MCRPGVQDVVYRAEYAGLGGRSWCAGLGWFTGLGWCAGWVCRVRVQSWVCRTGLGVLGWSAGPLCRVGVQGWVCADLL